ncbi:MAG TPA: hypothetical protein VF042_09580, partial [Gemmatimonadaceae bacterium]
MNHRPTRFIAAASVLFVAACTDTPNPSAPSTGNLSPSAERSQVAQDRLATLFSDVSSEVMALPATVYADYDETRGKLVFGIENENAAPGIQRALAARGISADDYVIKRTEPIHMMSTLRDVYRPTIAGTQIHFGNYLCTMGFNVDHAGGRSFITNSHCTNTQGGVEGTKYYQPLSTTDPT